MRVLLLGDSHLARFAPYPWLIARSCTVRAVSGSCAADLAAQWSDLDPDDFDVIAVSVGTNDVVVKPTTRGEFLSAIQAVVDRAGATPVLMVDNPGANERAPDADLAKLQEYAEAAAALVRSAGGASLNTCAVIAPWGIRGRSPDGIHVSNAAHLVFIPALRLALRRARRLAHSARRDSRLS